MAASTSSVRVGWPEVSWAEEEAPKADLDEEPEINFQLRSAYKAQQEHQLQYGDERPAGQPGGQSLKQQVADHHQHGQRPPDGNLHHTRVPFSSSTRPAEDEEQPVSRKQPERIKYLAVSSVSHEESIGMFVWFSLCYLIRCIRRCGSLILAFNEMFLGNG